MFYLPSPRRKNIIIGVFIYFKAMCITLATVTSIMPYRCHFQNRKMITKTLIISKPLMRIEFTSGLIDPDGNALIDHGLTVTERLRDPLDLNYRECAWQLILFVWQIFLSFEQGGLQLMYIQPSHVNAFFYVRVYFTLTHLV